MAKVRTLQLNFIALLMAVTLMFCGFGVDGTARGICLGTGEFKGAHDTLVCPGAGEFFTGSLPLAESQSVRELSTDWQSIVVLRPGRLGSAGSGYKELQLHVVFPESLRKVTFYREHSITEGKAPAAHDTEVIVCYIHNKDGAKG